MASPKVITVAGFKAEFSSALEAVRAGRTIVVAYGRQRRLGVMKGRASMRIGRDFALSDDDLLQP